MGNPILRNHTAVSDYPWTKSLTHALICITIKFKTNSCRPKYFHLPGSLDMLLCRAIKISESRPGEEQNFLQRRPLRKLVTLQLKNLNLEINIQLFHRKLNMMSLRSHHVKKSRIKWRLPKQQFNPLLRTQAALWGTFYFLADLNKFSLTADTCHTCNLQMVSVIWR